jgi:Ser/Thr protein kinase RdoA (MazF antagonist)
MYTEQQLREILANWSVPRDAEIGEVCIMDGTRVSDRVWTVGGGLILKTGDRAQLLKNLKIAKALAAQGLQSALPVTTAAGAEYLDGKEIFTLTHAIGGSELAKPERWGPDRADYGCKYGRSIAKLHRALAEIEAEIEPDDMDLLKIVTDRALPETKRHNELWNMGLPDSFFSEYISEFTELFGDLPRQLIHRDPNPSNILFDSGEVSGFIDFDLSERNIRLWDVCYCATGILSEWRGVEDIYDKWLDILGGILRGYGGVNAFTDAERRALWHVLCAIALICVSYFGANDEFRELAATSREMLVWIATNREQIEKVV